MRFNAGDKVLAVREIAEKIAIGTPGTIVSLWDDNPETPYPYWVQFPGLESQILVAHKEIELAESEPDFAEGDRVLVIGGTFGDDFADAYKGRTGVIKTLYGAGPYDAEVEFNDVAAALKFREIEKLSPLAIDPAEQESVRPEIDEVALKAAFEVLAKVCDALIGTISRSELEFGTNPASGFATEILIALDEAVYQFEQAAPYLIEEV